VGVIGEISSIGGPPVPRTSDGSWVRRGVARFSGMDRGVIVFLLGEERGIASSSGPSSSALSVRARLVEPRRSWRPRVM